MIKTCDKCGKGVPKKYIKAHKRYEIERLRRIRVLSGEEERSKKDTKELGLYLNIRPLGGLT